MSWKTASIKLAAANAIFADTPVEFEAVELGGKVAGYRALGLEVLVEDVALTACVKLVVNHLWGKSRG